jgi:hypothetical protein
MKPMKGKNGEIAHKFSKSKTNRQRCAGPIASWEKDPKHG